MTARYFISCCLVTVCMAKCGKEASGTGVCIASSVPPFSHTTHTDISILLEQINKSFKKNKSLKHLLVNSFVQLVSDWNFVGNPWIMNENPRKVSEVHQHQSYFIKISAGSHVNHCQAYQNQLSWLFIPPGKFLVLQLAYWQLQTFLNKVLIS